jgi:hypothetical protein
MQMDEIDYKQVAKNILKLADNNIKINVIHVYSKWAVGDKINHNTGNYYKLLKALRFLGLPELTEKEWKK